MLGGIRDRFPSQREGVICRNHCLYLLFHALISAWFVQAEIQQAQRGHAVDDDPSPVQDRRIMPALDLQPDRLPASGSRPYPVPYKIEAVGLTSTLEAESAYRWRCRR